MLSIPKVVQYQVAKETLPISNVKQYQSCKGDVVSGRVTRNILSKLPRGTGFPQLPSAVTGTVDHPLGSPSLMLIGETSVCTFGGRGSGRGIGMTKLVTHVPPP